jgi:CheY-like chemotaxis protein
VEGYPTRVAADAEAAERIFDTDAQNIDLIVTDFHLGEGPDGLDALRRMRAIAGRELPAVILSGDTSPALAALRGEPNVLLLRKPVDAGELVTALEQLFGAAT